MAGLYACFLKVAPLALPVEVFALVHRHHTPTLLLHPPSPPRARSLASSRQAKAWLTWLGMVWYGLVWEPGAFIMKCGDTCRHNISKLNSGLSVKLLQPPLSGFREGIRRQFRRGMFHIFAKKFHFGTPHLLYLNVAAWWLARLYVCFRKVAALALPVEAFALVNCPHTPTLPLHPPPPPPPPRARPPPLVKPSHGWLGLAWYGMAWCESQGLS